MKKFFTLFALVLMSCMGAWAEGIAYTALQNADNDGKRIKLISYYKNAYAYIDSNNNLKASTTQSGFYFTLLWDSENNGFRLVDLTTKKYIGRTQTASGGGVNVPVTTNKDDAGIYCFEEATPDCAPNVTTLGYSQNGTTCVYVKCLNPVQSNNPALHYSGTNGNVLNWDTNKSGGGNAWVVPEIADPLYSAAQISTLQQNISAAKQNQGKVGYPDMASLDGYTTIDLLNYNEASTAYNAVLAATAVKLPEDGKAYTIKAKFQDGSYKYIVNGSDNLLKHSDNADTKWVVNKVNDKFVLADAATGKYFYVESQDHKNASMDKTTYDADRAQLTIAKTAPTQGNSFNSTTAADLFGCLTIKARSTDGTHTFPLLAGSDEALRNAGANDYYYDYNIQGTYYRSCEFIFEEVDFPYTNKTLNAGGDGKNYATVALPYAMEIPAGVKAYAATDNGEVLTLTDATENSQNVPAGAYILVSESAASAAVLPAAATTTTVDNDLRGSITTVPSGDLYVLNKTDEEGVGFYKFEGDYSTLLGKAYLPSTAAANKLSFRFEDVVTAISAIEGNSKNVEIFDLQGRRLEKAQKGMNIINGRKVLVK